jgi:hypothetical protein
VSEPTTADHPGSGPTQAGAANAAGAGIDAAVAGGALVLALYGFLVIAADLITGEELVPGSGFAVAGIMIGCLLVGGLLGAFIGSASARD